MVRQLSGQAGEVEVPAQYQIVTESWNGVAVAPYLVYMPGKGRLLMLVSYGSPDHGAMLMSSDDGGTTWSKPRYLHVDDEGRPDAGMCVGLTYLGDGKLLANGRGRWRSHDYGVTWTTSGTDPLPAGWASWDPALVLEDRGGGPVRLAETRCKETGLRPTYPWTQAYIQFSEDEGRTWSGELSVPQWLGINEVALIRAGNGDWVAACRTNWGPDDRQFDYDHWCGLAVSVSRDEGRTWSDAKTLYEWGRHHPSMVLLPDGRIVLSYVVRLGYPETPDGLRQYGVEAVVSDDHGQTWDLDHRHVLAVWAGKNANASSQGTSSVLLPDGSILAAFGTGYRAREAEYSPRDIGLVLWRPGQ